MKTGNNLSKYQYMWIFAMFDLPIKAEEQKRQYQHFRKALMADGFMMLQFSVYARFCESRAHAAKFFRHIRDIMPPQGQVRVLAVTDKQFEDMLLLFGRRKTAPEEPPEQLLLF